MYKYLSLLALGFAFVACDGGHKKDEKKTVAPATAPAQVSPSQSVAKPAEAPKPAMPAAAAPSTTSTTAPAAPAQSVTSAK